MQHRLTRRDFHAAALSALAAAYAQPVCAATGADDAARVYLNRLTFGARQADVKAFDGIGAWLNAQLAQPATPPELQARLNAARLHISYDASDDGSHPAVDEMRALTALTAPVADLVPLLDYENDMAYAERIRPAQEVIAASLIRAVHSPAQLREVVTQFWHDHFNVNAMADETTAVFFPAYDATLRTNALGNFRTLLGAVAKSPAMLSYLNNAESRASPANENYARELLELHTLGAEHYYNDLYDDWAAVPGAREAKAEGYIDQDVYEVARAFTGWTIADGRWVDDGLYAPKTGAFHYIDQWHDPYQKRVLGVEFPPNQGPMVDAEQVLDLLAAHPDTARFITRKLMVRLGIETAEPAYHQRVIDVWTMTQTADDQIAQVIRAIVTDPDFSATPSQKMRRPFEYLAGLYRGTGVEVASPQLAYADLLQGAGWTQHTVRPPTGHADDTAHWANTRTLNGLVGIALESHSSWIEAVDAQALRTAPAGVTTWPALAEHWITQMGMSPAVSERWVSHLGAADWEDLPTDDPDAIEWGAKTAIAVAALSPEYLLR